MSIEDLARQIRTELADPAPQGFLFNDHAVRQDQALERLTQALRRHPDAGEVEAAVREAFRAERDGWALLKLLEVVDQLQLTGAAEALLGLARQPPGDDARSRFLVGRACEVLLRLPLNRELRARADDVSHGPLEDISRFRLGAQRAQALHRPRQVEWFLLAAMMALALIGLATAWRAL